jgi:hypothetical protein
METGQLRAGRPRLDSWKRQQILLFSIASRPALGAILPLFQWALGTLSPDKVAGT